MAVTSSRIANAFLLLAVLQALHSLEEYFSRLWDRLAPARFVSSLISDNLPFGFAVINIGIVALAFWCYLVPVRRSLPGARGIVLFWAMLESLNGAGHILFGISAGGYFPGLYTAPLLLLCGLYLLVQVTRVQGELR
jgi:Protein of unknown function with HXXEE motif